MLRKALAVVLLALVFGPPLRFVWNLGFNLHFHKQHPGKCSVIKKNGAGNEDFQILSSGLAFASSGMFFPMASPDLKRFVASKGKGSIQLIDLSAPNIVAVELTIKHGKNFDRDMFRPHGLSILEDKVKGEHLIYVVNHPEQQADRIEKFQYIPKTKELRHLKSFTSDLIRVTNDVTVVAEDKFYISNWFYFSNNFLNLIEHFYEPPLGGILYYDGTEIKSVKDNLFDPNGVILSKDKRYLYVSLPVKQLVQVYKRESDYNLTLVQEINVHTGLDNFHLSENGDGLYGGCHPIPYKAALYFTHPQTYTSPSQVLHLPLKNGLIQESEITQEFYDPGTLISASSISGVFKNKMLIGTVMDKLAVCDITRK